MAWKETCVMNERIIMISEHLSGNYSVSQLARRRGVSRKTVYKWIERYQEDQRGGLEDRSRAPEHHPNAISTQMEKEILDWKGRYPLWGAPKIHSKLQCYEDCPAESTVSNVLQRQGLTRKVRRRSRATPSVGDLTDSQGPNEVWCADFKGWFRTADGQRCDPLTISDAYSRYLLCCQGLGETTGMLTVKPLFEVIFREYGMPVKIRTDNGSPFASVGLAGLSKLSVWWLRLGIQLERIEPGHPEQNGRHERMHRTLKEAVASPPRSNLHSQQKAFDGFRREYNQERPHESLGQKPPAVLYEPSRRDYPEGLLEAQYPEDWQSRMVRWNGTMKWRSREIHVSQALIGQRIGLEPIGDGVWAIHFMHLELGHFDERKGQVQTIRKQNR